MRRPAVFFDRDNTLIANDGYLGDATRVRLIDGAPEAVARVRGLGYAAVVFSNQSGVARGMFPEEAVHAVNARMDELLHDHHPAAVIDRHEFCPYHPEASIERYRQESDLRKPRPGMIRQAAEKLALDLSRSWVIGDAPRDIVAGRAAGCRTILVTNPSVPPSPAATEGGNGDGSAAADFVVASLKEATDVIERNPPPQATEDETVHDEGKLIAATSTAATEEIIEAEVEPVTTVASESKPARSATEAAEQAAARPPSPASAPPAPAEAGQSVADQQALATPAPAAEERATIPALPSSRRRPTESEGKFDETTPTVGNAERLEHLAEQILQELRARHEQAQADFSVSKMLAGITQVIALAAVFFAYLRRDTPAGATAPLLVAQFLQTLTIALLIMGRQR